MVLCPEIVRKVQEELDRVIGSKRLPELSGRDKSSYILAVMKGSPRLRVPAWNIEEGDER